MSLETYVLPCSHTYFFVISPNLFFSFIFLLVPSFAMWSMQLEWLGWAELAGKPIFLFFPIFFLSLALMDFYVNFSATFIISIWYNGMIFTKC